MKHTPGPWIVVDDHPEHAALTIKPGTVGIFGTVAELYIPCLTDDMEEREANARLIAAAPDLLRTLIEIEERADEKMGEWSAVDFAYLPDEMGTLYELRQAARNAIEKVIGEP